MKCVLITLTYPYGDGDPFLGEEIPVLAKQFEKIYILPVIKEQGPVDKLPENVELLNWNPNKTIARIKTVARVVRITEEVRFGYKSGHTNLVKIIHRAVMYENRYCQMIDVLDQFKGTDFVFYAYWLSEPAYLLARFKMKNPDAFCISRAHGYDCFKDRGYNPFRREIAENIDCIYSISEKGKEDLTTNLIPLARNGHCPDVKVSHLGVDVGDEVNPVETEDRLFRIVSCSSVVQIKRIELLAEAIHQVHAGDINLEWVHFGGGPLLDTIRSQVQSFGETEKKRIILMGPTDHKMILDYYRSKHIDLFVNCSDAEGIPVSIMEAMECGIPCIARNVGGISELIENGKDGYLLPENIEPHALADAIEKLMTSGIDNSMRIEAKKKILREFSNIGNYQEFARELINHQCEGMN